MVKSKILKNFDYITWNEAIVNLHNPKKNQNEKNILIDLFLMKYYQLFN